MKNYFIKKNYYYLIIFTGVFIILFSSTIGHSQRLSGWDKRHWRKNIILLEGMGASAAIGLHYERVFQLGRAFSLRADVGVTPFYLDQKYNLFAGKSITPIIGGGFYIFPNAFKIGIG